MNILQDTKNKMTQCIEHLKHEYKGLRTGRVNPAMLDDVKVEVYGSQMPIKSLANVSVQERNLIVTPFDPQTAAAIAKEIQQSQMGLNPIQERGVVRVPIPPLNEELRKDIVKQAKQKTEAAKIAVRDMRRQANELARKLKASGDLAEDEMKSVENKVQTLTDEYCKSCDQLCAEKEKEILTI